mmetsp:Transcript_613/g.2090  ORF Transcript_613/g.2090 Transcript_613/m.2090 type:complete len:157 (-) Transcript_613:1367-1837(-)
MLLDLMLSPEPAGAAAPQARAQVVLSAADVGSVLDLVLPLLCVTTAAPAQISPLPMADAHCPATVLCTMAALANGVSRTGSTESGAFSTPLTSAPSPLSASTASLVRSFDVNSLFSPLPLSEPDSELVDSAIAPQSVAFSACDVAHRFARHLLLPS